jgi:hypothetical protein
MLSPSGQLAHGEAVGVILKAGVALSRSSRGHSSMEHSATTAEIKAATRHLRRQADGEEADLSGHE